MTRSLILVGEHRARLGIKQRRFVSMDDPHLVVLETTITPRGFSGPITIRAGVDAHVRNANVLRDKEHGSRHLTAIRSSLQEDGNILCERKTTSSQIEIAIALRVTVTGANQEKVDSAPVERGYRHEFQLRVRDGHPVSVTKTTAVFTSRDAAISSPSKAALAELQRDSQNTDELLALHAAAWRRLWDRFEIDIDADKHCQLVLSLHTFHTLQSISPHTTNLDAGVPARGLHREGYRGHVFWDEVLVLPFIGLRMPHVTRALLEYRWRRLPAARDIARNEGGAGASFP